MAYIPCYLEEVLSVCCSNLQDIEEAERLQATCGDRSVINLSPGKVASRSGDNIVTWKCRNESGGTDFYSKYWSEHMADIHRRRHLCGIQTDRGTGALVFSAWSSYQGLCLRLWWLAGASGDPWLC